MTRLPPITALAATLALCMPSTPSRAQDTADALDRARPAVVTVFTSDQKGESTGLGSGLIVRADGVVLTAWHVVAGAAKARVKLPSGASYDVLGLLGADKEKDFALLKVSGSALPVMPLGDSDKMRQGEKILTLGSPRGLELTASEGIVSAIRELAGGGKHLQITAPISPGNSGGPVMNTRGEAVGITVFNIKDSQALNFAVAINEVKPKLAAIGKLTPLADIAAEEYAGSAEELFHAGIASLPADPSAKDAHEKYEAALAFFRRATEKRADYGEAHFYQGLCLDGLDRHSEAEAELKQAIRIMPADYRAYGGLGVVYGKLGRTAEAIDEYKQALRFNADCAEIHCDLGMAYWNLDHRPEAIDELKEAIRLKSDVADFHGVLGEIYTLLGRNMEAKESLKEAIRINPGLAPAHADLGHVYLALGDRGRALEEYKVLKSLDTDLADKLFKSLYP